VSGIGPESRDSPVTAPGRGPAKGTRRPAGAPATRLHAVSGEVYADWEAVYRDNIDRVYRLMFGKVGNRSDAEDLTTEVFLATLRPLRLPASVGEVRSYLLAASRTALARYWSRRLGQQVTTLTEDVQEAFSGTLVESAAPQRAERILAALPERYRRILQLRFLDACSISEAAKTLGISVANAKVLQHRALRRAAEVAAQWGW
jgi:RNA polymerase sigma-70 factor (ECF subfamily)